MIAAKNCNNFLIGDEPCTFQEVCDTLANSKSASILWTELVNVAKRLKYPSDKVIKLSRNLEHGTYESKLYDILETWRGIESTNAKLHALLKILDYKKELKECTDALRKKFCTCTHSVGMAAHKSEHLEKTLAIQAGCPSNRLESVEIPLMTKTNDHFEKRESTASSNRPKTNRNEPLLKKIWMYCIHIALFLAVGGFICVLYLYVRRTPISTQNPSTATKLITNHEILNLTVTSFADYKSSMENVPPDKKIHLLIQLTYMDDWSSNYTMPNMTLITYMTVEGPIPLLALFGTLEQLSENLEGLTLKDNPNYEYDLCSRYSNDQTLPNRLIKLKVLEKLHLKIVGHCTRIYDLFVNHVEALNIVELEFRYNVKDDDPLALGLIRKLCYNSGNSLRTLTIERYDFVPPSLMLFCPVSPMSNDALGFPCPYVPCEDAQLKMHASTTGPNRRKRQLLNPTDFEYPRDLPKLHNVFYLILRSGYTNTSETPLLYYDVAQSINDKFPSLKKLEIEGILIPYQFLLDRKEPWKLNTTIGSLVELTVGIKVNVPSFDLSVLPTKLRRLNLYLFFSICEPPSVFYKYPSHIYHEPIPIVTRGTLQAKYSHTFVVTSNCRRLTIENPYVITYNV